MKRMVAMLLAGCLAFQTWIGNAKPVFGAQTASGSVDFGEAQAASESVDSGKAQSVLEVGVRSSAQFPFQGDVTVQIGRGSEVVESKDLKFEGSKASFAAARFEVCPICGLYAGCESAKWLENQDFNFSIKN